MSMNLPRRALRVRSDFTVGPWPLKPNRRQRLALMCDAEEMGVGGGRGTSKTAALAMLATQYVAYPHYRCVVLRKHEKDLMAPGNLGDVLRSWHPNEYKGTMGQKGLYFSSGAEVRFGHLAHKGAEEQHLGIQAHRYIIDEAGGVPSDQLEVISTSTRKRPGDKIPVQLIWASNPIGPSRQYLLDNYVKSSDPDKMYIHFTAKHNEEGLDMPSYIKKMHRLAPTLVNALCPCEEHGDWFSTGAAYWFEGVEDLLEDKRPRPVAPEHSIRFWDFAQTPGKGDYTVGARVDYKDGRYYLVDIARGQWTPEVGLQKAIDLGRKEGKNGTVVGVEWERGGQGKSGVVYLRDKLAESAKVFGRKPDASKDVRAVELSTVVYNKLFSVCDGPWNRDWLSEMVEFGGPNQQHDDQVDATAYAVNEIKALMATSGFRPSVRV